MSEKVKKTIGCGISERSVDQSPIDLSSAEGNEELKNFFMRQGEKRDRPWSLHKELIESFSIRYAEILESAMSKYPDPPNDGSVDDRAKYAVNANAREQRFFRAREMEGWYVRYITKLASAVEKNVADDAVWDAAANCIDLGMLISEFVISSEWNEHAIYGRTQKEQDLNRAANARGWSSEKRTECFERHFMNGKNSACPTKEAAYQLVVDEECIDNVPRTISLSQVKTDILEYKKTQKYRDKFG
tara:strand:- start:987 stop:1721 length:735 start_codon:yes stop_codon:yes gene_type:complete